MSLQTLRGKAIGNVFAKGEEMIDQRNIEFSPP